MQHSRKKMFLAATGILFVLVTMPLYVSALELDYPAIPTPAGQLDLNEVMSGGGFTVAGLIMFLYGLAVWIGGILAFIALVFVGFTYILSGSGLVGRAKALRRLKEILWGLVILLLTGVILNTINPDILEIEDPSLVSVAPGTGQFQGFTYSFDTHTGGAGGGEGTRNAGSFDCFWDWDGVGNIGDGECVVNTNAPVCTASGEPDPSVCEGIDNFDECNNATENACISTGGGSWGDVNCAGGDAAPPPDTGSKQALCSTGSECEPWCYEPKGSGNKGPAEALRSDPQYAENWPAIYPSSCTVSMEEIRGQFNSPSGWMRVSAVNGDVAGWGPFITGLERAGQEALSKGYMLNLISGYRPLYDQVRVLCWNDGRNASPSAMDGVIGSTVARPGMSNHGVGVAVDVELRTSSGSYMSRTCQYKKTLREIMFDSDPAWYRLSNEYWHFEYWPDGPPSGTRVRDYITC